LVLQFSSSSGGVHNIYMTERNITQTGYYIITGNLTGVTGSTDALGDPSTNLTANGNSNFFYFSYGHVYIINLRIVWTNYFLYIGGTNNVSQFNLTNCIVSWGTSGFC
jgi:hypothetical protein